MTAAHKTFTGGGSRSRAIIGGLLPMTFPVGLVSAPMTSY